MSPPRVWFFRILTMALGLALGLALAMLLRRARAPAPVAAPVDSPAENRPPTPPEQATFDYGRWVLGPCYRVEGDRLKRVMPPGRRTSDVSFPLHKAKGVRRIAVVGESTGEMTENAMAEIVSKAGCGDRLEILQCSTFGAHPLFAVRRVQEVVAYDPDVIVVAVGHNFRNPAPRWSRVTGDWVQDEPVTTNDPAEFVRMADDAYAKIFAAIQDRPIQLIALQLASNLRFRPASDPAYLDSAEHARAWAKWARNDVPGAIAELRDATSPLAVFERGWFESIAGQWEQARASYARARDLDVCHVDEPHGGCMFRASSLVNQTIAAQAKSHGASTLDVDDLFGSSAPHGLVGWETIWDHCHPNRVPLLSLARTALRLAAPAIPERCFEPPREEPRPHQGPSLEDRYQRFAGENPEGISNVQSPEKLGWAVFPDNAGLRRAVEGPLGYLLREAPEHALAVLQRYDTEVLPRYDAATHAAFLAALGQAARDQGHLPVARWCLERSVAVAPAARALVELALVHVRLGAIKAARMELDAAQRLAPLDAQVTEVAKALFPE